MLESNVKISPSIICLDLCNLEAGVKQLETLGVDMLHIDIIDGYFSPSMPIGIDIVKQLRKITNMPFDVHLMVKNNEFFVEEMLKIGVQQMCFHYESCMHVNRLVNNIKKYGVKAGIALNPATTLSVLEYELDSCDFVTLMLINPGYAGHGEEKQVSYAQRKISDLNGMIGDRNIEISVDGRVSTASIPQLVSSGANILVTGTQSLFDIKGSIEENFSMIQKKIIEGKCIL